MIGDMKESSDCLISRTRFFAAAGLLLALQALLPATVCAQEQPPGPVGNLRIIEVNYSSVSVFQEFVRLDWSESARHQHTITQYWVRWTPLGGQSKQGGGTDSDRRVGRLTPGLTYTFEVWAQNQSLMGPIRSITGRAGAAQTPTPAATPGNDASVTLSWTPSASGGSPTLYQYQMKTIGTTFDTVVNAGHWGAENVAVTGLTNDVAYTFRLRASNGRGTSGWSSEVSAVPGAPPGVVTNLMARAGNAQVILTWTLSTGTVTSYEYRHKPAGLSYGDWSSAGTGTTFAVPDLTNGIEHTFKVRALNGTLTGPESNEASATPNVPPAIPPNFRGRAGNGQVKLSWDVPTGSTVTKYQYHSRLWNPSTHRTDWTDWEDVPSTGTSHTVSGLRNSSRYDFQVRACNTVCGRETSVRLEVGPPGTPTNLMVTPGDGKATLSWIAPTFNETFRALLPALTGYDVRWKSSGDYTDWLSVGTGTTYEVTGLTNGTQHTFQVRAVNDDALGEVLEAMVTPGLPGVPSAPANLMATAGNASVMLSWTAPSASGTTPTPTIYQYRYRTNGSYSDWSNAGTGTRFAVPDLTNGTQHTFQIRALNGTVEGPESNTASATPNVPPGIPLNFNGRAGNGQMKLSWDAPTGSTVTRYQYHHRLFNPSTNRTDWTDWEDFPSTGTSHTVSGLRNSSRYFFQIRACNTACGAETGLGRVIGPPGALTNLMVTPGDGGATLSWSAPSTFEDFRVLNPTPTGYDVRWKSDGDYNEWSNVGTSTTHEVTGLTNGTQHTFQVRAVNEDAPGAATAAMVTPGLPGEPGAPASLMATAGNARVILSWTASSGTVPTNYEYRYKSAGLSYDDWSSAGTGTTYEVTGLINGTEYTFQVRALNGTAVSPESNTASTTPDIPPGAPANLMVRTGGASVILSWTAPSGTATSYEYRRKSAGLSYDDWSSAGTGTTYEVTGLINGTEYTFQVRALNGMAPGPESNTASTVVGMMRLRLRVFLEGPLR